MSGLKKSREVVNHSVVTTFTKDIEGLFRVEISVYSCVCPTETKGYLHDITEIECEFYLGERRMLDKGVEEIYVKLFGDGSFAGLLCKLEQEAQIAYYATTKYPLK